MADTYEILPSGHFSFDALHDIWEEFPNVHVVRFKDKDELVEGFPKNVSCSRCKGRFNLVVGSGRKVDYARIFAMEMKCRCGSRIAVLRKFYD